MNRRQFVVRSGALVVSFGATRLAEDLGLASLASAQRLNGAGSRQLDGWLAIKADGRVTAFTGKCELGHGLYTAQTQLIAEELCVPFNRVTLVQCDTALTRLHRGDKSVEAFAHVPVEEWTKMVKSIGW